MRSRWTARRRRAPGCGGTASASRPRRRRRTRELAGGEHEPVTLRRAELRGGDRLDLGGMHEPVPVELRLERFRVDDRPGEVRDERRDARRRELHDQRAVGRGHRHGEHGLRLDRPEVRHLNAVQARHEGASARCLHRRRGRRRPVGRQLLGRQPGRRLDHELLVGRRRLDADRRGGAAAGSAAAVTAGVDAPAGADAAAAPAPPICHIGSP